MTKIMQMKKPSRLLSVIIPNRNYERFIADSIASVAYQDYGPIELVIVDDASTDDSLRVIDSCVEATDKLERIEVVAVDTNVGKLGAINRVLDKINGEYCIILDSDDYLLPGYARRCIDRLIAARRQDPAIGFVYTDCNLVAADGRVLDRGKSAGFDPVRLDKFSYIPEPGVVLTRALVEAGPFDETIRRGTKHHKWLRIVANGWAGLHLPEALFCYRMHENNLSGIGKRITAEVMNGHRGERILSGYWPTEMRSTGVGSG